MSELSRGIGVLTLGFSGDLFSKFSWVTVLVNLILEGKSTDLTEHLSLLLSLMLLFFWYRRHLCECRFSDAQYHTNETQYIWFSAALNRQKLPVIKGTESIWSKVGLLFQRSISANTSPVIDYLSARSVSGATAADFAENTLPTPAMRWSLVRNSISKLYMGDTWCIFIIVMIKLK